MGQLLFEELSGFCCLQATQQRSERRCYRFSTSRQTNELVRWLRSSISSECSSKLCWRGASSRCVASLEGAASLPCGGGGWWVNRVGAAAAAHVGRRVRVHPEDATHVRVERAGRGLPEPHCAPGEGRPVTRRRLPLGHPCRPVTYHRRLAE